ncbi:hypothetical protein ACS3SW_19810 [Roseobacteraceae bacterium S113]
MSQAPAVSKLTRLRRLVLPRSSEAGLLPAERAALALRHARRSETWSAPNHLTFVIPLVGPKDVSDWDMVVGLLNSTLRSFIAQTDGRWSAIVCCQVHPDLPDDPRISYLPFAGTVTGNDKWLKLDALYEAISHSHRCPGLTMTFDADDIAHPDLVARLLARQNGSLLTHGIVYDAANDRLAQASPQSIVAPGAKAFWKLCGSCAAIRFDPGQPSAASQWAFLRAVSRHEHRMVPYLTRLSGQALIAEPESLALYLINHGENFGVRRGRVSFKTRFVERFEIKDAARAEQLRRLFGLAPS